MDDTTKPTTPTTSGMDLNIDPKLTTPAERPDADVAPASDVQSPAPVPPAEAPVPPVAPTPPVVPLAETPATPEPVSPLAENPDDVTPSGL